MKLYANNQVYLQNFDLDYIFMVKRNAPDFIMEEIMGQLPCGTRQIDLSNGFDFRWTFRTLASIDWLMSRSYILDFKEFEYSPLYELEKVQEDALDAWSAVENGAEFIDATMPTEMILEPSDFNQIIYSAQAIIGFKIGLVDFPHLPDESQRRA